MVQKICNSCGQPINEPEKCFSVTQFVLKGDYRGAYIQFDLCTHCSDDLFDYMVHVYKYSPIVSVTPMPEEDC